MVTNDDSLGERVRLLVNHGRLTKYEHTMEGYNYRLDALQAAILDAKLPYLREWTAKRRDHAAFYTKELTGIVETPVEAPGAKHVYYMYEIRTRQRDALMKYLSDNGISCGIHYPIPLHLQPAYKDLGFHKGHFPVSEQLAGEILSIPIYPELTEEQRDYIVSHIKQFFS